MVVAVITLLILILINAFFAASEIALIGLNDNKVKQRAETGIEPLMTKVTRFLGREHTCWRISLPSEVSLIYQAIPVVPAVFYSIYPGAIVRKTPTSRLQSVTKEIRWR